MFCMLTIINGKQENKKAFSLSPSVLYRSFTIQPEDTMLKLC